MYASGQQNSGLDTIRPLIFDQTVVFIFGTKHLAWQNIGCTLAVPLKVCSSFCCRGMKLWEDWFKI